MTDREKAIVMAHTGICMLTGNKFQIFHKYVEDIMDRPIMTHEIGWLANAIKEKSKADFMALCAAESSLENPNRWIPVSERLPEVGIDVLMCDMEGTMYLSHRASSGNYFDEWGSKIKDIRAWMPLPKPYVPDTNDGKMGESEDKE